MNTVTCSIITHALLLQCLHVPRAQTERQTDRETVRLSWAEVSSSTCHTHTQHIHEFRSWHSILLRKVAYFTRHNIFLLSGGISPQLGTDIHHANVNCWKGLQNPRERLQVNITEITGEHHGDHRWTPQRSQVNITEITGEHHGDDRWTSRSEHHDDTECYDGKDMHCNGVELTLLGCSLIHTAAPSIVHQIKVWC